MKIPGKFLGKKRGVVKKMSCIVTVQDPAILEKGVFDVSAIIYSPVR
jgi:hypothetical protein